MDITNKTLIAYVFSFTILFVTSHVHCGTSASPPTHCATATSPSPPGISLLPYPFLLIMYMIYRL